MKHCCICGQLFEGYGNNPAPVETRGECCDDCNINIVVPRRLLDAKKAQIRAAADALTSTPLQRAESAKLNALVGKVVEIEYADGTQWLDSVRSQVSIFDLIKGGTI